MIDRLLSFRLGGGVPRVLMMLTRLGSGRGGLVLGLLAALVGASRQLAGADDGHATLDGVPGGELGAAAVGGSAAAVLTVDAGLGRTLVCLVHVAVADGVVATQTSLLALHPGLGIGLLLVDHDLVLLVFAVPGVARTSDYRAGFQTPGFCVYIIIQDIKSQYVGLKSLDLYCLRVHTIFESGLKYSHFFYFPQLH